MLCVGGNPARGLSQVVSADVNGLLHPLSAVVRRRSRFDPLVQLELREMARRRASRRAGWQPAGTRARVPRASLRLAFGAPAASVDVNGSVYCTGCSTAVGQRFQWLEVPARLDVRRSPGYPDLGELPARHLRSARQPMTTLISLGRDAGVWSMK